MRSIGPTAGASIVELVEQKLSFDTSKESIELCGTVKLVKTGPPREGSAPLAPLILIGAARLINLI